MRQLLEIAGILVEGCHARKDIDRDEGRRGELPLVVSCLHSKEESTSSSALTIKRICTCSHLFVLRNILSQVQYCVHRYRSSRNDHVYVSTHHCYAEWTLFQMTNHEHGPAAN